MKGRTTSANSKYHIGQSGRIVALRKGPWGDFGTVGGFVENYHNLSSVGHCWVYDDARVEGNALVRDNVQIRGNTVVSGDTVVKGYHIYTGEENDIK